MAERKTIGTVTVITDSETSYDNMGDVSGGFSEVDLHNHTEHYGYDQLLSSLTYMQWQVWEAVRDINSKKDRGLVPVVNESKAAK